MLKRISKLLATAFLLIAIFVFLCAVMFAIQIFGFLSILDVLGRWSYTAPITIVAILLIFRDELVALMRNLSSARLSKEGFELNLNPVKAYSEDKPIAAVQTSTGIVQALTQKEIKQVFSNIPALRHVSERELDQLLDNIYLNLTANGIVTRKMLDDLASSNKVMDTLADLYTKELGRKKTSPLDPSAVAAWGGYLFVHNVSSEAIEWVRNKLRHSTEYREKHDTKSS